MVVRGQRYRTTAQEHGAAMRASGRDYRGGYTYEELKDQKKKKEDVEDEKQV